METSSAPSISSQNPQQKSQSKPTPKPKSEPKPENKSGKILQGVGRSLEMFNSVLQMFGSNIGRFAAGH